MYEKKSILIYYHNDQDGIVSAGIIKHFFKETVDLEFVKCEYSIDIPLLFDRDTCFIVDFSFSKETMQKFYDVYGKNLVWIDHHKTAIEKIEELNDLIVGVRDVSMSGSLLTWKFFYCDKEYNYDGIDVTREVPKVVLYTNDYDLWKFEFKETKAFGEAFNTYIKFPEDIRIEFMLYNDDSHMTSLDLIQKGQILLDSKQTRIEKNFEEGIDGTFEGYKTRFINTNHDTSNTGEFCYKNKSYPIALVYSIRGDKVIVGLRSNTIDVGELAKKHGGGGHQFASGFTTSIKDFFDNIYKVGE